MSYYFTNDENLKSEINLKKVTINNTSFSFYTDNGVFSKNNLDFGTRSLLESLPDLKGKALDLGCGYGPIGIFLAKMHNMEVDMVDINLRSINLAKKNGILNKVNINVFESDGYQNVNTKYDYIITNPPIRVGKKILYKLLFEAKDHLNDNGELWLVINKDQGAKTVMKDLEKEYKVTLINKNKGFYIIKATK